MPDFLEFEHYQILRNPDGSPAELGRGGMGITYKAFDRNLRCNVALKVITTSLLEDRIAAERFLREARAAARLRHRNVASVFHLGRHGCSYFYAMELIEGETVEGLVKRAGPLDCRLALEITQQVAGALIAAEKQQLIHRDIKPSNLMLVREGDDEIVVKVIDFGLAKSAAREADSTGTLTLHGFAGTPYYASPEQLEHEQEDIRSDIYSLGVTLWYMLTGNPPFVGSVASVIAQHLEKPPPFDRLVILPRSVVSVLRGMLEKDRDKRIQTPAQLRLELRSCLEQLRASTDASPPPGSVDDRFETITLGSARSPGTVPPGDEIASPRADTPCADTPRDRLAGASSAIPPLRPSRSKLRSFLIGGVVAGWVLAGLSLWFFATRPGTQTMPGTRVLPALPRASSATASQPAFTAGRPWVNSLGMRFVPLGKIEVAVWQTRVHDFEAFVRATGYDAIGGMSSIIPGDGFKLNTMSWKNPGFAQTPEHPVVGVSWEDANQFCAWLTQYEQSAGLLAASFRYRLPTDREWSIAVGLIDERGATPEERSGKVKGVYPWGRTFPPAVDIRNYAGGESSEGAPENWNVIPGFHDPFPRTGPVSAFAPNQRGLYNLGGNVWEWCADKFNGTLNWRTLRGGSWATWRADDLLSSARRGYDPYLRSDDVGFRCVIAANGEPQ
jgi:serine/threonine protein kinase/formylglycine-generating enzyme required for sulfatase activity